MMGLIGGFAKAAGYLQDYSDDENDLASISVLSSLSSIMPDTPHIHVAVPSIPKSIDPETEVIITTKKYANGELYEGPMMDGMRHGDGAVSIRADGSKFSGRLVSHRGIFLNIFPTKILTYHTAILFYDQRLYPYHPE